MCSWEQDRDWYPPGPLGLMTTTIDLLATWQVCLHAANPLLSFPLVLVNMLDPIWKWFGSGHYGHCAAGIGPDSASDVVPFFQRRPRSYCAVLVIWKAWSGVGQMHLVWKAWSGVGQMHLVWKQAGGQEALGLVLAECNRPTFRLGCLLPLTALIVLCKTSLGPIWFWLTVSGLGQMDPVWKQPGVQESRGLPHGQSFQVKPGELDLARLLG